MHTRFGPFYAGRIPTPLLALAFIAASCMAIAVQPSSASELQWRNGVQKLQAMKAADMESTLQTELDASRRHIVVSFAAAPDASTKQQLQAAGIKLLAPLGNHSYFAALSSARSKAVSASGISGLTSIQPIATEHKMHPVFMSTEMPTWAFANETETIASEDPIIGAYVVFHRDVDLDVEGYATCVRNGATVRDELRSINGLVIELPLSRVQAVAAEDNVQWIEPPLPRMSYENDSNRARTEADVAQAAPYSLDGSGVTVLVYDGGTARATHVDFQGRLTVYDGSGEHYHPTHVAGTIGGAGVANATYKGMAPAVTLLSYGFEDDGSGTFLYTNPGDIESDYNAAINTHGAEVSNNSIGTNTCANGFPCSITGDYGATSAVIDAIVGGSLGQPFRILWANGNERGDDDWFCPGCGCTRCQDEGVHTSEGYHSTAPPSTAKNHITVGAVNSNDDSMTSFSSFGPTDDGRLKPDICAPGCQSNGDNGVTSTWNTSDTAYDSICGTSMATPTATGCAALLLQDYKAQYPSQALFRNSTLKVWFAHTAVDLGNAGPDYKFGYGSIRIPDAIDLMRSGQWLEGSISQSGSFSRTISVSPGDTELKVTLAWDDVPGTPNVSPSLVNDLDLRVYGPGSVRYYPWTLDPANPGTAAVRTQEDHINNIEQVLVTNPTAGVWTIEVYGYDVPDGPQTFSLCGDGATQNGISIGLPNGVPEIMTPGVGQDIDVQIVATGESLVAGSPTMHWRYDGGTWQTQTLTLVSGNLYRGALPGPGCSDTPEFYFSAQGTVSGVVTYPAGAPLAFYTVLVGEDVTLYTDNFETDQGWVAENLGASSGDWERGVPVNDPNWAYDPTSDSDGSGQCLLTQNETGNTDIDGGAVRITSPTYDLSGGHITIGYDYYLYLNNTTGAVDMILVEMNTSNGVGTWSEIARHTTDGGLSWRSHVITQNDIDAAGLTVTSQTKIRFTANDADPASIVEAGIDALYITGIQCISADGACCAIDGTCSIETSINCTAMGGTYQGNGTSCSPNPCPQPTGACCYVDGSCTDEADQTTCEGLGGTWEGLGTTCASTTCPIAPGACCYVDGSCSDEADQAACEGLGGTWEGHGTTCASTTCPIAPGACCYVDGTCTDEADQAACEGLGGTWEGHGTTCAGTTCPIAPGACCYVDGSCTDEADQATCEGLGGTWEGHGTTCASTTCPIAAGACCHPNGSCTDEADQSSCEGLGGVWEGHGTDCATTNCPQPIGACCIDDVCQELTQAVCDTASGVYQGDGTTCDPNPCLAPCTLLGDIDDNGVVDGDDIQGFVRTKLGVPEPADKTECADFGTGTIDGDTAAFVQALLGH